MGTRLTDTLLTHQGHTHQHTHHTWGSDTSHTWDTHTTHWGIDTYIIRGTETHLPPTFRGWHTHAYAETASCALWW